jgi:hypothetical protein
MADLFLLTRAQMRRVEPFFPRSRGLPRVDDRRVISGIIYVIRNGLQWNDAPRAYAQDAVQPICLLERPWRIRAHLRGPGCRSREAGSADDRHHPSEGASDGGEPAAKAAFPRCIGLTNANRRAEWAEPGW